MLFVFRPHPSTVGICHSFWPILLDSSFNQPSFIAVLSPWSSINVFSTSSTRSFQHYACISTAFCTWHRSAVCMPSWLSFLIAYFTSNCLLLRFPPRSLLYAVFLDSFHKESTALCRIHFSFCLYRFTLAELLCSLWCGENGSIGWMTWRACLGCLRLFKMQAVENREEYPSVPLKFVMDLQLERW